MLHVSLNTRGSLIHNITSWLPRGRIGEGERIGKKKGKKEGHGGTQDHGCFPQVKVILALHFIILTLSVHIINYNKRQKYKPINQSKLGRPTRTSSPCSITPWTPRPSMYLCKDSDHLHPQVLENRPHSQMKCWFLIKVLPCLLFAALWSEST